MRLARWGSAFLELMLPPRLVLSASQPDTGLLDAFVEGPDFSGEMQFGDIHTLRACHIAASKHTVIRRDGPLQPRLADDRLFILLQLRGEASFEQAGRTVELRPREWSVYETARDFRAVNKGNVEQLMILVPRERLFHNRLIAEESLGRRLDATSGVGSLAANFAQNAMEELSACSMKARSDIEEIIIRLFQQALAEQISIPSDGGTKFALAQKIRAYIDSHLEDPLLSVDKIAANLGYGKRSLHKAFAAESDGTIGTYILKNRLERCRKELIAGGSEAITKIAFKWGFNSSAHFSTSFKETYGISPRDFRQTALG
ncbi:AraC-like ligand-binding domain-containing protein [Paraburkholderia antibiotica]|uniref:Helix-turn-helix domain-containing protein n=1 Tax=Paraburkholderia antibiotica TaxID=2728839 RepID=A0A7Y0A0X0_9BURK|nr:helix-turn-helix domain-containing protein [Paraburkholderia antibiotica]NML34476.1 helix-turn-helix domain-containing protein [Paraburkholderia antibiotica]